jgi:hypothetical protein
MGKIRFHATLLLIIASTLLSSIVFSQDEPPLPEGLEGEPLSIVEEPDLPAGIAPPGTQGSEEPTLPPGLSPQETEGAKEPTLPEGLIEEPEKPRVTEKEAHPVRFPFDVSGFWEARGGVRTQGDPHEKDESIGETRLQLQIEKLWESVAISVTNDFLYDPVLDRHRISLEEGEGWVDLREASLAFSPASFVDVKVGRQILTWGTGDLVFINDLFPKDFNSFFIGRDEEYLKAPSDAARFSLFSKWANLDVVYTPRFDADRFVDGRRISYFNANLGRLAGRDAIVRVDKPDEWFEDDEIAIRIYRSFRGYELAVYGYDGFWKSPAGQNPLTGLATFPDLSVYGASVRGSIGRGIGNIEFALYNSEDDERGDDPLVRNGELRFLVGYEQELAKNLTMGVQYYLEYMMDHNDYRRTLPPGTPRIDEVRHVLTLRLTKLLINQNLRLSLFTFYSPSDNDAYLRPNINYKIDDHWSAEVGGNIFTGTDDHTFFGQFRKNSNVYGGVRYSF